MNETEIEFDIETVEKACIFLASLASDLETPMVSELRANVESGKTKKAIVIAFDGSEDEIQMAIDFVANLLRRRKQQAIAANN